MFKTMVLAITMLAFLLAAGSRSLSAQAARTRIAIVGLDHDHVWGMLSYIEKTPEAELVAIADPHPDLVSKAKGRVQGGVTFYDDYVKMLDEAKPAGVIITAENDRHLAILRECAKRHINVSTEKPMASTGSDARQMLRLAEQAHIKLMVNYFTAWAPATPALQRRVAQGEIGPISKLIAEYGHQGPKEIGVSKEFGEWLYDPVKNGGGALVDFGCYGAQWALWLKGRPTSVFAVARKLKADQHNKVEDDATIILEYPDGTAILQASWDWPYGKGQVEVFGTKGSLLATGDSLYSKPGSASEDKTHPEGVPQAITPPDGYRRNPVAYFVHCIQTNETIMEPLSGKLNVGVVEILDAAKESIRTGRTVPMPSE